MTSAPPFPELHAFAMAAVGSGISGGDRILFELLRWARSQGVDTRAYVWDDGASMMDRSGAADVPRTVWDAPGGSGLVAHGRRARIAARRAPEVNPGPGAVLYSASDFLPDVLPAAAAKARHPEARWVAGLYLLADGRGGPRRWAHALSQRAALRLMRRSADLVLVLNEGDRAFLERRGFPPERVHVVGGGVDLAVVDAVAADSARYDACYVGRFHEQKGLPNLARAWAQIVRVRPGSRLAVVGGGDERWERWVRRWVADADPSVTWLGHQSAAETYRVMKSSALLLFPSRHESYGLVVAEALACGVPVVAFAIPAVRRSFPQGVAFVPPGDVDRFADMLLRLLSDPEERTRLAEEARSFGRTLGWGARFGEVAASLSRVAPEP